MNVSDVRDQLTALYRAGKFTVIGNNKTGSKTVELINACFEADEAVIFGEVNPTYTERELAWYRSMSLNVNDIPGGPPQIWKTVATELGLINSNYGWCIWSPENLPHQFNGIASNQFNAVLQELTLDPSSRRAMMIYTRPSMHADYKRAGMCDFICTNAVQYFIRDDLLVTKVDMRSNDAVFGYNNDFHWQEYVRDLLLQNLRLVHESLRPGPIFWNAGSLHVYERHFKYLEAA